MHNWFHGSRSFFGNFHASLSLLLSSHKQNHRGNHKAVLNEKPTDSPQRFFIRSSIWRFSFEDKGNFSVYDIKRLSTCLNSTQECQGCDPLNINDNRAKIYRNYANV